MLSIPPSLKWAGYTAIALHVLRKATHRFHTHFSFPQDIPCGICIMGVHFEPIRLFGVRNKAIAEKMKRALQQAGFIAMITDNAILDGTEDASTKLGLLGAMNHYAADAITYPGNWSSAYGKDIQSHPKGKVILHALRGFRIMPFVERGKDYDANRGLKMRHLCKRVNQLLENGTIIKTHVSIKAAADYVGVKPACISAVLAGKCKTIKGYKWAYADAA